MFQTMYSRGLFILFLEYWSIRSLDTLGTRLPSKSVMLFALFKSIYFERIYDATLE